MVLRLPVVRVPGTELTLAGHLTWRKLSNQVKRARGAARWGAEGRINLPVTKITKQGVFVRLAAGSQRNVGYS
jgi:hypothetical protein